MDSSSKPKVSVIVPIYNVEKYLRKCVDSILAQTLTDIEVILVDDGSPDECPQIVDEYAAKDPRVVPVHQRNGGLSAARNGGLSVASGKSPATRANASSVLSMHLRALSVPTEITRRGMFCVRSGTSDRSTPFGTTRLIAPASR